MKVHLKRIVSLIVTVGLWALTAPTPVCAETATAESVGQNDTAGSGSPDPRVLSPAPGIAMLGTGGALLLTSIITGSLALVKNSELEDNCPGGGCAAPYHDDMDRLNALAAVTDVFIPLSAALFIAGTYTLIMSKQTARKYGDSKTTASALRRLEVTGNGLRWRF
jgi:hypothetical protein